MSIVNYSGCETAGFETRGGGYLQCRYCGSLHPEELAELIKAGKATLQEADWKYGYPHKYYVKLPNHAAGEIIEIGNHSTKDDDGDAIDTPITGPAPEYLTYKFYTIHLKYLPRDVFDHIIDIINAACEVKFSRDDDGELSYEII